MVNNFGSLVCSNAHWSVAISREDYLLGKAAGVLKEDCAHFFGGEVVEEMAVEDAELRTVGARHKLLVDLPRNGAVIAVLRNTLFEIDAIDVHVFHNAWATLRLIVEIIARKLRACLLSFLDAF